MAQNSPTWYDILGVDRDASPEQIKAAWRDATDKFEPGSGTGQFRLFNEAADVLLDPARRAAYDAELAPDEDEAAPYEAAKDAEPAPEPEPVPEARAVGAAAPDAEPAPEAGGAPQRATAAAKAFLVRLGAIPLWAVGVVGLLATAAVVMVVVLVVGADTPVGDIEGIADRVAAADAGPEATAAAERALTAVLSFDYRHMEADRDRSVKFLTPKYQKEYLKTFNELLVAGPDGSPGPAVKTKAVVTADVLDTAVVDADSKRVRVVAFVNQSSVKGDADPAILQNRVVVTMVLRDDDWLVDNIKSY